MVDKAKFEKVNVTITGLTLRWAVVQGEGVIQKGADGIPNGKQNRHSVNAYLPVSDPQVKELHETVKALAVKSFPNAAALMKANKLGLPYAFMDTLAELGQKVHESEIGMVRIRPWTIAKPASDKYALKVLNKYREPFNEQVSLFDAKANLIVTLSPYDTSGSQGITMYLSLVQIMENGTQATASVDLSSLPVIARPPLAAELKEDDILPF